VELEGRDIRHDGRSSGLIAASAPAPDIASNLDPLSLLDRLLRSADVARIPSDDENSARPCAPERDSKVLPSHRLPGNSQHGADEIIETPT
jgi:hypothetical protein